MKTEPQIGRGLRWWLLGYVVLIGTIIGGMFWMRHSAVARLSSSDSTADWNAWRKDVGEKQPRLGPIERRIPKSDEPPALVLLRDYFAIMLVGAFVFSSMLYWIVAWFIMGMITTRDHSRRAP